MCARARVRIYYTNTADSGYLPPSACPSLCDVLSVLHHVLRLLRASRTLRVWCVLRVLRVRRVYCVCALRALRVHRVTTPHCHPRRPTTIVPH